MTYLDIRYDRMADGLAGAPRRVSAIYGDYRTVEGLQIPFLIETGAGWHDAGQDADRNSGAECALDDSTFENPAAPHSRNRGG